MSKLKTQNRTINNMTKNLGWVLIRIVAILVIIYTIFAQNHIVFNRNYVYSSNDMAKTLVGYKILHISDICNTSNNVVKSARKAKPNIIVLSGGYEDTNGNCNRTVDTVNKLCEIAPVYYIYNTNDTVDCLADTQAVNITDSSVDISPEITDATTFIKDVYGSKIIKDAEKGDDEALQYIQYVSDELSNDKTATMKLCGINNMVNESFEDIQEKSYSITGPEESDFTVMINGNLANLDSLCATNIDIMFVGGTFGKSSEVASCSKGPYSYLGTQLFVSGGCGNYDKKRIANVPEVQLITLSDGTIKQNNPLENLLDMFIDDVGTIYDNDGGFHEYTYKYGGRSGSN